MKRILLLMGVLVLSIGILAACGDDDDDNGDDAGSVVSEVATEVGGATDETATMAMTESDDDEGTSTEASETGTETSGTGTEASGTGTEASGTEASSTGTATDDDDDDDDGTSTEASGTSTEASGTGTESSGTGTEASGTGTEASGTGTTGDAQTFKIDDEITIGDLTFIVRDTEDDDEVDDLTATPEAGMELLGVEIDIEGDIGDLTQLPELFQNVHLEDKSGETYDMNAEATAEMLTNMSMSSMTSGTVKVMVIFDVPDDNVDEDDLTLVGSTPDDETFRVSLDDDIDDD